MASIKLKHSGGNGVIIAAPTSNPSSDKTLTLPSTETGTIVSKDSANSLQNITGINGGQLGNRNLIINGAMQVAQRGTSSTSSGYYTNDRFAVLYSGTDEAPTQAQVDVSSGTTPYTNGFRKALKITNGNQTSGAGAGDYIQVRYKVEAQDIANSGWNYVSSSSNISLSFWVKSSVAQNFYFNLIAPDGTAQNYAYETGALSANTWTKITKQISGNSNLTFDNNNEVGLQIDFWAFAGTSFTASGVALNQWGAYSSGNRMPDHTTTWYTTNDSTFEITGVSLEVGSVATDFEHRSFGQELALCQRYFYANTSTIAGIFLVDPGATSNAYGGVQFPATMRVAPTVVLGDLNGNNDGKVTQVGAAHNLAATASDIGITGIEKVVRSGGNSFSNTNNQSIAAKIVSASAEL
jgi:hypothetical protein